jgi:hypothetical protein
MNVVFATISEETEKKIIKQILREKIMCQIEKYISSGNTISKKIGHGCK